VARRWSGEEELVRRVAVVLLGSWVLAACGGGASGAPESGASTNGAVGSEAVSGGESEGGATASGHAGRASAGAGEFQLRPSTDAAQARGERPSQIRPTATEAALRLFVVHPESGPIPGIVIKLIGPDGRAYYTDETDSHGYGEVLVPAGARYEIEYLSLGERMVSAHVDVPPGANQNIRLTLRYRRRPRAARVAPPGSTGGSPEPAAAESERFVLDGVLFQSGSALLEDASFPRLERVVEYMTHRPGVRIRIAGHTDNVGNPQRNRALSEARAQSVRAYLMSRGIDGSRIEAVGFGDTQPVAPNDTEAGRAQNRRIEVIEL
jgi:outer membrane protein OmpA-like peptidoglycan-associated protein